ncbi:hypothetical protein ACIRQO_34585 [Streptomyces anulatus]
MADFEIRAICHDTAAAGTVLAIMDHSGEERVSAELRWVRENAQAPPRTEPMPGQWRLVRLRLARQFPAGPFRPQL